MRERLLLDALWPYGVTALVIAAIGVQSLVAHFRKAVANRKRSAAITIFQVRHVLWYVFTYTYIPIYLYIYTYVYTYVHIYI